MREKGKWAISIFILGAGLFSLIITRHLYPLIDLLLAFFALIGVVSLYLRFDSLAKREKGGVTNGTE